LDDPAVQESLTQVIQEDRHEAVRARAERYLPKVQYFARRRAEAAGTAAAGQEK
jgi:hypothetical protein